MDSQEKKLSTGGSYSPSYWGNLKNWKLHTRLSIFSKN
jgi:hypothetical protein